MIFCFKISRKSIHEANQSDFFSLPLLQVYSFHHALVHPYQASNRVCKSTRVANEVNENCRYSIQSQLHSKESPQNRPNVCRVDFFRLCGFEAPIEAPARKCTYHSTNSISLFSGENSWENHSHENHLNAENCLNENFVVSNRQKNETFRGQEPLSFVSFDSHRMSGLYLKLLINIMNLEILLSKWTTESCIVCHCVQCGFVFIFFLFCFSIFQVSLVFYKRWLRSLNLMNASLNQKVKWEN